MIIRRNTLLAAISGAVVVSACMANGSGQQVGGTILEQTSAETLQILLEGNNWTIDLQDKYGDNYRPVVTFFQRSDGSLSFDIRQRTVLNARAVIDGSRVKLKYSLPQECGPRDYYFHLRSKGDGTFSVSGRRDRKRCHGGTSTLNGTME